MKFGFFFIFCLLTLSEAQAERFAGRLRSGGSMNYSNYSSAGASIPSYGRSSNYHPRRHEYDPAPARIGHVEVNYRYAYENPAPDEVRVRIDLNQAYLNALESEPFAVVTYYTLSHSRRLFTQTVPVDKHSDHIKFRIPELASEEIYGMSFKFYRLNDENLGDHVFDVDDYFGVTSGESATSKVRHQAVTVGLVEEHDWRVGRTGHGNARYNVGFGGGWCGIFQRACFEPFSQAFAYTNSDEPSRGFRLHSQLLPSGELPAQAARGPIHGSYANLGAHKFMILGYCLDTRTVFTLDGNSGRSVRLNRKSLDQVSSFGVISDALAKNSALTVFPAISAKNDMDVMPEDAVAPMPEAK